MPVGHIDQFKRHVGGAFHGIFISASGTKTAMAAERHKLKLAAFRAAVHGATVRRVATVDHLLDIFNDSVAGMKGIYHFLIMVSKNFL